MARSTWKVNGTLRLDPQFPELKASLASGDTLPLAGVRVLVEAKEFGMDPTWDNWGEDVTDADGNFSVKAEKDGSGRMFRIRVMFKGGVVKVYPESKDLVAAVVEKAAALVPGGVLLSLTAEGAEKTAEEILGLVSRIPFDVDWWTVLEDQPKEKKRQPGPAGNVHIGELVFRRGGDAGLGDEYGRRHAEIWYVVKRAMKFVNDLPGVRGFRPGRTVAFKHPHSTKLIGDAIEASYTDPFSNVTMLIRNGEHDDFDLDTILHELCHHWVFQHSTGETGLAWQLFAHGTTHDGRLKKTWTGFHEAFAETMSNEITRREFGWNSTIYGGRTADRRPLSRPMMRMLKIRKAADVEFFEDGWLSAFGLLLCEDVCRLDMETQQIAADGSPVAYAGDLASVPRSCAAPRLEIEDLMHAVAEGGDGRDDGLARDDMTLVHYLDRLADTAAAFTFDHVAPYLRILDPEETAQPWEILTAKPDVADPPVPPGGDKHQQPKPQAAKAP